MIKDYDGNQFLGFSHVQFYEDIVKKFRISTGNLLNSFNIKQRRLGHVRINSEILELYHQKDKLWTRCKQNRDNTILKNEPCQLKNARRLRNTQL